MTNAAGSGRQRAADTVLSLEGIEKRFAGNIAIDKVDLAVRRGEFFSLLGASGCGKTTLLRTIAGLETPDHGRILIDGLDVTDMPAHDRPVNMVFQSYALFPHMSVEQNIGYGLKADGMAKSERADRVSEVLRLVQLAGLERRKPDQLSGGQKQRVALARALVKQPRILLLDEPLAALDRKLRESTQFELSALQERTGITFVLVTHDQEEAMTMSDRIAIMDRGSIVQIGTPREIYEQPNGRFVADFIGTANLLNGTVRAIENGVAAIRLDQPAVDVRVSAEGCAALNTAVTVMIRPEKITAHRMLSKDSDNRLEGVIAEIAYLGDMSIYHVQIDGGPVMQVSATNRRREDEPPLTWDDRVSLTWHPDNAIALPS